MGGTKIDIVDSPKEHTDIGTDAVLVEETENPKRFTQSNEVRIGNCLFLYAYQNYAFYHTDHT